MPPCPRRSCKAKPSSCGKGTGLGGAAMATSAACAPGSLPPASFAATSREVGAPAPGMEFGFPTAAGLIGPDLLRGHDLPPPVEPVGQQRGLLRLWPGLALGTIVDPAPRADLLVPPDNRVERHSPAPPPGARPQTPQRHHHRQQ